MLTASDCGGFLAGAFFTGDKLLIAKNIGSPCGAALVNLLAPPVSPPLGELDHPTHRR